MLLDIRPIKTEADHEWALKEVEKYFDNEPNPGSKEEARFEILTTLIMAYEQELWPIEDPEPIPYLKSVMEMTGRTQADLAKVLGSRSRASEVLARKRFLSRSMVNRLAEAWKIPMDPLLKPYPLVKKPKRASKASKARSRAAA